jgi:hypothetical protein
MSKTTFSNKCEILGSLWVWYKDSDNEAWQDFFTWADIGLPLAYAQWQGMATIKDDGKNTVEDTWKVFCEMIDISPDSKYTDLSSAFAASPNPEL